MSNIEANIYAVAMTTMIHRYLMPATGVYEISKSALSIMDNTSAHVLE